MTMSKQEYGSFLKEQRGKKSMSQAQVSENLGMSRTSYIAVEQGTRELTVSEAAQVSKLFEMDIADILPNGVKRNNKKYEQMLFAFLRVIKNKKKLTKTKLAKLLYLADFAYFYEHHESMSGLPYRKIQYGPVPDYYFSLVEDLDATKKINIKEMSRGAQIISEARAGERIGDELLGKAERKLITKIAKRWDDKSTAEIVGFAHSQIPYEFADYGEIIPYGFITQEDSRHVY